MSIKDLYPKESITETWLAEFIEECIRNRGLSWDGEYNQIRTYINSMQSNFNGADVMG